MKSYALRRVSGGLVATQAALVHANRVSRPLLAVDTGSLYTIVEPKFISALGIDLGQPVDYAEVTGIGGRVRAPCFVIERLHCFGKPLSRVRVLAVDFARILPDANGVLGLAQLRALQVTIDIARGMVSVP